ncbi:hypothetical protein BDV29DRAFT_185678 [Aspergillus leporis]|jgi:hypothetical protein|uniref:Uncharacterized protein n=1 Tax=Aspergillus leporis TaxID=41062 RepID=A0A5N5WKV7_9EURO|nr:hypothetical protein BDV29DRAFT_185678 [Aspergillus leporis]
MRQIVKTSNSGTEGHFNIGKGGPSSATSTPRKPRKNAATASKAPTPTSGKRKQDAKATEDTEVAVEEGAETPMRVASAAGAVLKEEPKEDVFMGHDASPSKRVRRASVLHPGMVSNFGEEDSQTELDSSVSEYLPEDSYKMVEDEDFWFA